MERPLYCYPRRTTFKEGLVRLGRDLQWSLQPSLKARFITEKKMLTHESKNLTERGEKTIIFLDVAEKH